MSTYTYRLVLPKRVRITSVDIVTLQIQPDWIVSISKDGYEVDRLPYKYFLRRYNHVSI